MEKGKVNPKVQTLMGGDSSFASEQRPTGDQSFFSKVLFLFFVFAAAAVLPYRKILRAQAKGQSTHTE